MKRKIFTLLFILTIHFIAFSQMPPPDNNYNLWNWENNNENNWRQMQGGVWVPLTRPFDPNTDRLGLMKEVYKTKDYTKAKGWELVMLNFTQHHPYFVLYNRHKSILRVFFYIREVGYNEVLITLSYDDAINPGLLSMQNEYLNSSKYIMDNPTVCDNDRLTVVIRDIGLAHWCAADFPILFDNNIKDNRFIDKEWVLRFFGSNNYNIRLHGTSSDNPKIDSSQLAQHTISSSKSSLSANSFSATYAKLHKEVETNTKYLLAMKDNVKHIDTTVPFFYSYKNTVEGIKGITSVMSAATGISSGISAILGFAKFISGAFDESSKSTKPVSVIKYINLDGEISNLVPLGGKSFSISGVEGGYHPSDLSWTPFHCPMGTVTLKETPKIKVTTPYRKYGDHTAVEYGTVNGRRVVKNLRGDIYHPSYPTYLHVTTGPHLLFKSRINPDHPKYSGRFKKYKFDDNVHLIYQDLPGLELIDVNFAIICKPNGSDDTTKYKVNDKYIARHIFWDGPFLVQYGVPLANPVYLGLSEGRLVIHKYDKDNEDVYFGTPYVSKDKLKGVVLEVPEHTDVKLGVIVRFKSEHYDTPIIFKAHYNFEEEVVEAETNPIYFNDEQPTFLFSDYYHYDKDNPLNYYITLKDLSSRFSPIYLGGEIVLDPGFESNIFFTAIAVNVDKGLENGNTIVESKNFNCQPYAPISTKNGKWKEKSKVEDFEEDQFIEEDMRKPLVYPNPTRDIFTVETSGNGLIEEIEVYNIMGKRIYYRNNLEMTNHKINISNSPSGVYMVHMQVEGKIYTERIILNK